MTAKISLLVVDDSRLIRVAARKILGAEFDVHEAEDGEVAWQKLTTNPSIELVMSDLSMPNLDGLGLLRRIRESDEPRIKSLPVVIASGAEDDDGTKETAIARGASSFVTKPFDPAHLLTNIRTLIEKRHTARALEESRQRNRLLQARSGTDELTGFATEQAFLERGEEQLAFALRHQTHVALVGLQVDRYRVWYLRRGKEFAGKLLAEVARTLAGERRREDIVARLDPDEFGLLLPSCNATGARLVADKLRMILEGRPYEIDGETVRLSVSVGVVCPTLHRDLHFDALLAELKDAIKAAHQSGGGRVQESVAARTPPRTNAAPPLKTNAISEALIALRLNRPVQTHPDLLVQALFPLLEHWARNHSAEVAQALQVIRRAAFTAVRDAGHAQESTEPSDTRTPVD